MNCPHCKFVWTRLDICDYLPVHDCSKFQGERPPAKPPREIILDYLRANPGSSIGEIVSSCSGCKDRLYDAVRELVKTSEIRREGENPPIYFGVF